MHIFSDTFLNVGSIEESIDNGPRSTQHGAFFVSGGGDDPWYPSLISLSPTKLGKLSRTRKSLR